MFRDLHQTHEIDRPIDLVEILVREAELLQQRLRHAGRAQVSYFKTDTVAVLALRQLALQRFAQAFQFAQLFLVDVQVAVARELKLVAAEDCHARKEFRYVRMQDRRQEYEAVFAAGDLRRHRNHAREHARRLHDGHARFAPECIFAFEFDHEVQAFVEQLREWMRGVETQRCQHRHQFAEKVLLYPLLLRRVPLAPAQEPDPFSGELGKHFFIEDLVLARHKCLRLRGDLAENLAQRYAVGTGRRVGGDFLFQAGHADFEKLVEIAVDDAQKAQALERRHAAVFGQRQHAAVEFELSELAIEIELGSDVSFSHYGEGSASVSIKTTGGALLRAGGRSRRSWSGGRDTAKPVSRQSRLRTCSLIPSRPGYLELQISYILRQNSETPIFASAAGCYAIGAVIPWDARSANATGCGRCTSSMRPS